MSARLFLEAGDPACEFECTKFEEIDQAQEGYTAPHHQPSVMTILQMIIRQQEINVKPPAEDKEQIEKQGWQLGL